MIKKKPLNRSGPFLLFTLSLLVLAVLFLSCSVEKPVAPKWETKLTVPLIDKTFTVWDILGDNDKIFVGQDSVVGLQISKELNRYSIGERLKIDGIQKGFEAEVGNFTVTAPDTAKVGISLAEIYPPAQNIPPGQKTVIPAFDFESPAKAAKPFESFQYVKLAQGVLDITVKNNLPIALGVPPNKPLVAKIWAESPTGEPLDVVTFESQIPAYGKVTESIDLAGHVIPSQIYVAAAGASPGTNGQQVTIDPNWGFTVSAYIHDLKVAEAVAKIPSQHVEHRDVFPIEDSVAIRSATVKRGRIRLSIRNDLPITAAIGYELPDFRRNGTPLHGVLNLPSRQLSEQTIVLDGYTLEPGEGARPGEQALHFNWSFDTQNTGDNMVHLYATDKVVAEIKTDEIVFSQIRGELGNVRIDLEPVTKHVSVPEHLDSLRFGQVTLEVDVQHTLGIPARADIRVQGKNREGKVTHFEIHPTLDAAQPGETKTQKFVLGPDTPGLIDFMNSLPEEIAVTGKIQIGQPGMIGDVSEDDWVQASVAFRAPLAVAIPEQTTTAKPDTLKMEDGDRQDVVENLHKLQLKAEIENHLPLGASVTFYFARDTVSLYTRPAVTIGPIAVSLAQLAADGRVAAATSNQIDIKLTDEQIAFFGTDPIITGVKVHIPGTHGQIAVLTANDYIHVRALGSVSFTVDPEKDQETN